MYINQVSLGKNVDHSSSFRSCKKIANNKNEFTKNLTSKLPDFLKNCNNCKAKLKEYAKKLSAMFLKILDTF